MSGHRIKPGDVLDGKYRVEKVLGAGGMGVVVAARHVDLGQNVAIKFMLKEALADPAHGERFLREAKAAVQLKSIHTARVLDVGRMKNGEPYMVMEYLEGCDLDAEIRARGRLPPHVAVDYILQASEALAEAHVLGLIHRDVKLKNLFLTHTVDGRPLVKVLDFGLAKTLGPSTDVSLTATNSVFGSPQYMSPEQMRSAKDVDARSDIWSVGVCLFELLTGRVPFDGNGVAEICAMVLKDPVPRPSMFATGIPSDLENAVLKCLEKEPAQRYQSFAEMAFALQQYATDEGSARRIAHVQSARQVPSVTAIPQLPPVTSLTETMMTAIDGGARTLNAWDSDSSPGATRRLRLSRTQWLASLAVFGSLLLFGIGLVVAMRSRSQAHLAAQRRLAELSAAPPAVFTIDVPPPVTSITPQLGAGAASIAVPVPTIAVPAVVETSDPHAADGTPLAAGAGIPGTKPKARPPTSEKHAGTQATAAPKPATPPVPTGSVARPPANAKKSPSGAEYM